MKKKYKVFFGDGEVILCDTRKKAEKEARNRVKNKEIWVYISAYSDFEKKFIYLNRDGYSNIARFW